jgi:PHD/YefM family antitoxin component YafN of YafNO toxin-antitoxin module
MTTVIPLTEFRRNLSELVNQAFYEDRLFGVAKGTKTMGTFVGTRLWKEIIHTLEAHNPGLADTLALAADPEMHKLITEGEEDVKTGKVVSWKELSDGIDAEK